MRLAQIAAAIAIATAMTGTFAATPADEAQMDQTQAATTAHKWYQAGDRELQSEEGKAKLDREGFPQYSY